MDDGRDHRLTDGHVAGEPQLHAERCYLLFLMLPDDLDELTRLQEVGFLEEYGDERPRVAGLDDLPAPVLPEDLGEEIKTPLDGKDAVVHTSGSRTTGASWVASAEDA